jgi:very-short-patch-repair endonuclease
MLQRHGYIVLRFTAVHVFQQPGWLLDTLRAALASR